MKTSCPIYNTLCIVNNPELQFTSKWYIFLLIGLNPLPSCHASVDHMIKSELIQSKKLSHNFFSITVLWPCSVIMSHRTSIYCLLQSRSTHPFDIPALNITSIFISSQFCIHVHAKPGLFSHGFINTVNSSGFFIKQSIPVKLHSFSPV